MHWRMVFCVNLIHGLVGILLILLTLPQSREKERRKLDAPGLVALAAILVSLLLAQAWEGVMAGTAISSSGAW